VVCFDTGSKNLWIPDISCGTGVNSTLNTTQCQSRDEFNSSASSTYVANGTAFNITYGVGFAIGFDGMDTVRFGAAGSTQLVIPNTTFAQITDFPSFLEIPVLDGLIGMGIQPNAVNNDTPPFINAIQQGLVGPLFTVYLDTAGNSAEDDPAGGDFTFGGLDLTNCGDIIDWVPFRNEFRWYTVQVDNVTVDGVNISTSPGIA